MYTVNNGQPDALYVNGQEVAFPPALASFIGLLADHRNLAHEALLPWQDNAEALGWLAEQLAFGYWFLDQDE